MRSSPREYQWSEHLLSHKTNVHFFFIEVNIRLSQSRHAFRRVKKEEDKHKKASHKRKALNANFKLP
ncbi:MAG: hypothetical protein GY822_10855 [Deltaproteobacteria bacterium]|nr:hypothetical protein [Deltaproteobacteria bacterium]